MSDKQSIIETLRKAVDAMNAVVLAYEQEKISRADAEKQLTELKAEYDKLGHAIPIVNPASALDQIDKRKAGTDDDYYDDSSSSSDW